MHIAEGDGPVRTVVLGTAFADGQAAHAVVPAHAWQAAEPLGAYTLAGCTVAPAFGLKQGGEIYQVNVVARTSTFVAGAGDHGLSNTQGMAIGTSGTIYLVGNSDVSDTKTQGTIVKGVPRSDGRIWSVGADRGLP